MRFLFLITIVFSLSFVFSQEIQLKTNKINIDDKHFEIFPLEEIFIINLTDNYFVYTLMNEGLILHSIKSRIYNYQINKGVVIFFTDYFNFELRINNKNDCEIFELNDESLKWIGDCCIDFSVMLRKK